MSGVTEAEAKKRWCPFARTQTYTSEAIIPANRGATGEIHPYCLCIGSACMAWRWNHPGFDHNIIGEPITPVEAEGYCGLAGCT